MILQPEIRTEDGKEYYYFRFQVQPIANSITVYQVSTGLFENRMVCYFEVRDTPAAVTDLVSRFAQIYSNVQKTGTGYRFVLNEAIPDKVFEDSIAVFDFAEDGTIVGIEIV